MLTNRSLLRDVRSRGALVAALIVLAVVAGAVVGGVAAATAATAPSTAAPTLARSAPHVAVGDGPAMPRFADAVTISPNGDGVNDAAKLTVCAPSGAKVAVRVFHWGHGRKGRRSWSEVWRSASATVDGATVQGCGSSASTVVQWRGEISSRTTPRAVDSAYRVTVCTTGAVSARAAARSGERERIERTGDAFLASTGENIDDHGIVPAAAADHDSPATEARETARLVAADAKVARLPTDRPEGKQGCLAAPVLVRVRRAALSVPTAGSFTPGSALPLTVGLDAGRTAASVQLLAGGHLDGTPIMSTSAAASKLFIPNVMAGGYYTLRLHVPATATAPATNRCVPLVIRSMQFPVTSPPPRAALVVWPELTWRAYNQYDADRNGIPDTWYSRWANRVVTLAGPHERAAMQNGCIVSQPFTDWLQRVPGRNVQHITDVELGRMTQAQINQYSSVWFPDHTEYYEGGTFTRMMRYRRQGGHLVFLSANNFFRRVRVNVQRNTERLVLLQQRKDVTSDYRLYGVGFDTCCFARAKFPRYEVGPGSLSEPWVLAGTNLGVGDRFGLNGLEIDKPGPRFGAVHFATIAKATVRIRPGKTGTATMAYVRWPGGGTTFASGNMIFTTMLRNPTRGVVVSQILDNLWAHTTDPGTP